MFLGFALNGSKLIPLLSLAVSPKITLEASLEPFRETFNTSPKKPLFGLYGGDNLSIFE